MMKIARTNILGAFGLELRMLSLNRIYFDKERSFYPVVLIVIVTYYLLFAAMAKSTEALAAEAFPALIFAVAAALGFRRTPWSVVTDLGLHV